MSKKVVETNCETGEEIFRDMNEIESIDYDNRMAENALILIKREADKAQKLMLLEKIGLTEDELKVILS